MTRIKLTRILESAWETDNGFFYEIRYRVFNPEKAELLLNALSEFKGFEQSKIDKGIVRLLWYIPIFLEYQKNTLRPALDDSNYSKYVNLSNRIQGEVERILGYP